MNMSLIYIKQERDEKQLKRSLYIDINFKNPLTENDFKTDKFLAKADVIMIVQVKNNLISEGHFIYK